LENGGWSWKIIGKWKLENHWKNDRMEVEVGKSLENASWVKLRKKRQKIAKNKTKSIK